MLRSQPPDKLALLVRLDAGGHLEADPVADEQLGVLLAARLHQHKMTGSARCYCRSPGIEEAKDNAWSRCPSEYT